MLSRQLFVYVVVGVLSVVVDIGTMQTLLWFGYNTTPAVSVAFVLALSFNYVTHQRVTFRADHSAGTMLRFAIVVFMNYCLTLVFVHAGERWLHSILAGKLLSLPLVTINGFILGKYWIFRHKP